MNPGGGEIFRTYPDRPWGPPSLLYNGYRVFPGGKSGRGVTLTPHPLLVPWSWKTRATPLLPLWAVQPVQSLSACTRVTFTFTYILYKSTIHISYDCNNFSENSWNFCKSTRCPCSEICNFQLRVFWYNNFDTW